MCFWSSSVFLYNYTIPFVQSIVVYLLERKRMHKESLDGYSCLYWWPCFSSFPWVNPMYSSKRKLAYTNIYLIYKPDIVKFKSEMTWKFRKASKLPRITIHHNLISAYVTSQLPASRTRIPSIHTYDLITIMIKCVLTVVPVNIFWMKKERNQNEQPCTCLYIKWAMWHWDQ